MRIRDRSRRRHTRRRDAARRRSKLAAVERLEDRTLLSIGDLTGTGGFGPGLQSSVATSKEHTLTAQGETIEIFEYEWVPAPRSISSG